MTKLARLFLILALCALITVSGPLIYLMSEGSKEMVCGGRGGEGRRRREGGGGEGGSKLILALCALVTVFGPLIYLMSEGSKEMVCGGREGGSLAWSDSRLKLSRRDSGHARLGD